MQKGLSLVELARKIEGNKPLKYDLVAAAKDLHVSADSDGKIKMETSGRTAVGPAVQSFPILAMAHDQVGQHLGVPAKYYDRMLADAPDLLAANVNTWLARSGDRRMVRTLGGDMRAFLSDKYQRIENEEIAEMVLPILIRTPGIEVVSAEVTERRLYIQATTNQITAEVKVGDPVQAGVVISNSEVGQGAVSIRAMIWRLWCSNGAIAPDGKFAARHVGRRIDARDDLNAMFTDETRRADDNALLLKVRDVVSGSLDQVFFNKTVDRMRELTGIKIEGDPAKAVEVLAQKVGANESERGGILRALIEGGDLTGWGLLNAVTAQAHGGSYDRAVEFEQAGGSLLSLARAEWRDILEAV